jgi:uncharacterized membrane protein
LRTLIVWVGSSSMFWSLVRVASYRRAGFAALGS